MSRVKKAKSEVAEEVGAEYSLDLDERLVLQLIVQEQQQLDARKVELLTPIFKRRGLELSELGKTYDLSATAIIRKSTSDSIEEFCCE